MNPNEHGKHVAGLFDGIAGWYDFLNHFLSLGLDRSWRKSLVATVRPGPAGRMLDLAAGTLDVSREILRRYPTQRILALDFSRPMLRKGVGKIEPGEPIFPVQADGRALPLPDACVDTVTIAFGIRNILPRDQAYAEILRVLTPGGRLCILEFGTGQARIWGGLYNFYLTHVLPRIGRLFSRDPQAYRYLADTITAFPPARELAGELRDAGFATVGYHPLCSGIIYVHVAEKPLSSAPGTVA